MPPPTSTLDIFLHLRMWSMQAMGWLPLKSIVINALKGSWKVGFATGTHALYGYWIVVIMYHISLASGCPWIFFPTLINSSSWTELCNTFAACLTPLSISCNCYDTTCISCYWLMYMDVPPTCVLRVKKSEGTDWIIDFNSHYSTPTIS